MCICVYVYVYCDCDCVGQVGRIALGMLRVSATKTAAKFITSNTFLLAFSQRQEPLRQLKKFTFLLKSPLLAAELYVLVCTCVFVCVCECVCHNHGLNKIEFDCDFGQNGKRARAGRVGAKL